MNKLLISLSVAILLIITINGNNEENEIVQKFLSSEPEPVHEYDSIRYVEAHSDFRNMTASMQIDVKLRESNKLSYRVISESGSETIRHNILDIIKEEKETLENLDAKKVALSILNYRITLKSTNQEGLLELWSTPLRKDDFLIDGIIFINNYGELVKVDGKLIKNPSWKISRVNITRYYNRFAGFRMVEQQNSTAMIRFGIGKGDMNVRYDYISINGIKVESIK